MQHRGDAGQHIGVIDFNAIAAAATRGLQVRQHGAVATTQIEDARTDWHQLRQDVHGVNIGHAAASMAATNLATRSDVRWKRLTSRVKPGHACTTATRAPAASATALIASGGASSGSIQTIAAADMSGDLAETELFPPRNVTLTLSSHADWDATTAVVTGTDENGATVTESLSIPNGGNATVTGTQMFRTVTQLVIPAQSGTGGTFTFGVGSTFGTVDHIVAGATVRDNTRSAVNYAEGDLMPVARDAEMWVTSETAVKDGDPVYVRVRVASSETIGAVRATPSSGYTVRLKNARFTSTNSAGLSRVDLNLPAG